MGKTLSSRRPFSSVLTTKNNGRTWINAAFLRDPDIFHLLTREEEYRLFAKINKAVRRIFGIGPRAKIKWSKEKESIVLRKMRKHERAVFKKAFLCNIRLVLTVARKFNHHSFALEDILHSGVPGLMIAILRFDLSRGNKFSTYAVYWIRHAIQRDLCDLGEIVRTPVHAYDANLRMKKLASALAQNFGRDPTTEELAEASGLSLKKINKQATGVVHMFSLNMRDDCLGGKHHDSKRIELQDIYANTEALEVHPFRDVETSMDMERIRHIVQRHLRLKEQIVLELRFFEGLTLEKVSKDPRIIPVFGHFPVSRERVRQVHDEALEKIRSHLRGHDRTLVVQE